MNCEEFLFIRKKGAIAIKALELKQRISFEEMALLCHLYKAHEPIKASDLADYQHVIRPTMTHRLSRLTAAGYVERQASEADQRILFAKLVEDGQTVVLAFARRMEGLIHHRERLHRCAAVRLIRYVEAAGSISCKVADILLLTLWIEKQEMSPAALHNATGLLQPSCAMASARLVRDGLVAQRNATEGGASHPRLSLTKAGEQAVQELLEAVAGITVHRN